MRVAEALAQRAEIQRRLYQTKDRLLGSAKVQEGDSPPEDPAELLNETERLIGQLEELIRRINRTNLHTAFNDSMTVTDAIAARTSALSRRNLYSELADAASTRVDRFSRSEIKYVSTVDINSLRRKADAAAKEYRQIDSRIQELNWITELME